MEVTVAPPYAGLLTVFVPENHTARLLSDKARIVWNTASGDIERTYLLKPPTSMLQTPITLMNGKTLRRDYLFGQYELFYASYPFYAFGLTAEGPAGYVQLPDLEVDGTITSGLRVKFSEKTYFELAAINC